MWGPLIQLDCPQIYHYLLQSFLGLFSSCFCHGPFYALYWVLGFLLGLGLVFYVLIISESSESSPSNNEEERESERDLFMIRRMLGSQAVELDDYQRQNIFHVRYLIQVMLFDH